MDLETLKKLISFSIICSTPQMFNLSETTHTLQNIQLDFVILNLYTIEKPLNKQSSN